MKSGWIAEMFDGDILSRFIRFLSLLTVKFTASVKEYFEEIRSDIL